MNFYRKIEKTSKFDVAPGIILNHFRHPKSFDSSASCVNGVLQESEQKPAEGGLEAKHFIEKTMHLTSKDISAWNTKYLRDIANWPNNI